jgi:hypothetical protein
LNSGELEIPPEDGFYFALIVSEIHVIAEVGTMSAKFDIFKKLPDGQPIWIKAAENLEEAKRQLSQMAAVSPGDYFIYNATNGQVITA